MRIVGLKSSLSENHRRYEKAVREMQFFKKKYEKASAEVTKAAVQQRLQTFDMDSASRIQSCPLSSSVSLPPPSPLSFDAAPTACPPSISPMASTCSLDSNVYPTQESTELVRHRSMAGHVPSSTYWQSTASSMSSISEGASARSRKSSVAASVYSTFSNLTDRTLSTHVLEKSPSSNLSKSAWHFSRNPSKSSSYSSQTPRS